MNYNFWQVGTHHDWFPVPGSGLRSTCCTPVSTRPSMVRWSRSAKRGRPSDRRVHRKDLGILAVAFRAQRSWGAGD